MLIVRGFFKAIIKSISISYLNNVAKEDWSVSRPAIFHPRFSSGSTVLFGIQKNCYIAIHFWKNNFLCILLWPHSQSYGIWLISSCWVSDVSYHWVFFHFLPFPCVHGLCHFGSLKYPGFFPTCQPLFLLASEHERGVFSMIA